MMQYTNKIALLGLAQDNNSSYLAGPAMAPERIREAIHCSCANMYTETGVNLNDQDLWHDVGNAPLANLKGEQAYDAIYKAVQDQVNHSNAVVCLGGDHSVSFPAISAHFEKYPNLNILHFDAHPDLYENMQSNYYSHASPFARLMETGRVNRLVQVGIRTLTKHQREQAERYNIEMHEMRDLSGIGDLSFDGPVYISFDLDALDPAFAPGVSHFEPGGLSVREALNIIHSFKGQVIGADVVELNPLRDPADMTAMVAAKICKELMGRILIDQGFTPNI